LIRHGRRLLTPTRCRWPRPHLAQVDGDPR
jgi:hypothetical protein